MKRSGAGGLNESIESFFGNDLLGSPLRRFERTNKRAASFARESDLYPQTRVVYRVVRFREDSLQLPRPNPAVQQQARPRRVTAACIHIHGFKQEINL